MLLFLRLLLIFTLSQPQLVPVTVDDFERFVNATQYTTDAERYGWSIVQIDVYRYRTQWGAFWCQPDGLHPPSSKELPVTQVSYNDAIAYCRWAGVRLPTYAEYWQSVALDTRPILSDNRGPIASAKEVNVVGNVWDITQQIDAKAKIRLAGGSLFCSQSTCHGTIPERELFVDSETANIHIGFSVLVD